MCGRYYSRAQKQRIGDAFRAGIPDHLDFLPSYNIAPQSFQPIVRLSADTEERELALMRWGLIPFWAKDAKIGFSTINARAETVATSPAFREALQRRRCLVPASGFYEWQKLDANAKQPYAISVAGEGPIAFAGLWDRWRDKVTGAPLESYTIITTDANELMNPESGPKLHDRMPVILAVKDYTRWLAPAEPSHPPVDLLRPYPAEVMTAWKVSTAVGNVKNNGPELCEPI
jgi:putative SOS response-associated peptidase YedK